ncbi:uncharacterized protein K02A2.6-like, partial [Galendromus occidentalis]|uniref:RNA-directed DNA polymerase n=1 Tax=Galendromus occidentalis TaxID=34638 RepID=A0AAJ7P9D3_9ACAR
SAKLHSSKTKLISYFNDEHMTTECVHLPIAYKSQELVEKFFVVTSSLLPTISGDTAEALGLIRRVRAVSEDKDKTRWMERFPEVFRGPGTIRGAEVKLKLKENYVPVVNPCRKIPVSQEKAVKEEIARMIKNGVVAKVNTPTEFVSNIVVVPKAHGRIRLCLDPQHLNKALQRGPHPTKRLEQIQCKMAKAAYFTTLDADESFWQLKLETASSYLCTFITPFGRYRFLKVPYGITTASDEFQRVTDEIFGDMDGVIPYIDDIIIWGETKEQQQERVEGVLQRCREIGLVLNPSKCHFNKTSVRYLGHIVSRNGFRIDPDRIEHIQAFETPSDKKELQRFLGVVNFVGGFIENMSEKTKPLRDLVKDDVEFLWTSEQQKAFEVLKESLTRAPVLRFFDPSQPVVLSVDASEFAVGAVLLQDGRPVAYNSRALSAAQQKLPQIEKEMIAIANGCSKYHYYIFGHTDITVETDHKPLESIFTKAFEKVPFSLQPYWLSLQKYGLRVKYKPGKKIPVADFLSRIRNNKETVDSANMKAVASIAISDERLAEYVNDTDNDPELTELKNMYQRGWPNDKKEVPEKIWRFWPYRDEIHVYKGLVLRTGRIIVPANRRAEVLDQLHASHRNAQSMQRRSQGSIYWPTIHRDIEIRVQNCEGCQRDHHRIPKEPLISSKIPTYPWQIVSADILHHEGENYQVIVDHYSFFWEITRLPSMSASAVIKALWEVFQRHGYPEVFRSDNATQYVNDDLQKLFRRFDISHRTSSPLYAQSNSMAERAVQEAKRLLKKVKYGTPDFYNALLEVRSTPRTELLKSPCQRLMSRQPRTLVPTLKSQLQPRVVKPEIVRKELQKIRKQQKKEYDHKYQRYHTELMKFVDEGFAVEIQNLEPAEFSAVDGSDFTPHPEVVTSSSGKEKSHPIALSTDIPRAYMRIAVNATDQPFFRFLWRAPGSSAIKTFQMVRVTWGVLELSPKLTVL